MSTIDPPSHGVIGIPLKCPILEQVVAPAPVAVRRLRAIVPILEPLHDTDYGMREFLLRDCNGFWITFGRDP